MTPLGDPDARPDADPPAAGSAIDWLPPAPPEGSADRGGESGSWPPVSNARLGMWMLIATETVFFGGMVGAFLVLRLSAPAWPPPSQPRLPVAVTALDTGVLLLSSYSFSRGLEAVRRDDGRRLLTWLGLTALLGGLFLAVQGAEWVRLVRFGLRVSSGAYGGTFYTLIGTHGAHVLAALTWLLLVTVAATRGRYTRRDHVGVAVCAMYWHFVVALWPLLYLLVYLV